MSGLNPERRTLLYVEDAIEHARHAMRFAEGRTEQDLTDDLMLQFAVVRALEVVGEATRAVPEEVRVLAPDIPWRQIVVTRNKIAHQYFGVRLDIVWRVVQDDLPVLVVALERLLESLRRRDESPDQGL
jgi:uncharacterized protein with HEPN domain